VLFVQIRSMAESSHYQRSNLVSLVDRHADMLIPSRAS